MLGQKQRVIIEDQLRRPVAKVVAKRLDLFVDERDLPIPAALALADGEEPVLEIDILEPKRAR